MTLRKSVAFATTRARFSTPKARPAVVLLEQLGTDLLASSLSLIVARMRTMISKRNAVCAIKRARCSILEARHAAAQETNIGMVINALVRMDLHGTAARRPASKTHTDMMRV